MAKTQTARNGAVIDPITYFKNLKASVTKTFAPLDKAMLFARGRQLTPNDIKFLNKSLRTIIDVGQFEKQWMAIADQNYTPDQLTGLAVTSTGIVDKLLNIGVILKAEFDTNSGGKIIPIFATNEAINAWLQGYSAQKEDFTFEQIAAIQKSFGAIGIDIGGEFFADFAQRQVENPLPETASHLVNILTHFGLSRRAMPEKLTDIIIPALTSKIPEFGKSDYSNSLMSFARLAIDPGAEFVDAYVENLMAGKQDFKPETIFQILKASATLHALTGHEGFVTIANDLFNGIPDFEAFFEGFNAEDRRAINVAAEWFGHQDKMMEGAENAPPSQMEIRLADSFKRVSSQIGFARDLERVIVEVDTAADFVRKPDGQGEHYVGYEILENHLYAEHYPDDVLIRVHPKDALAFDGPDELAKKLLPLFSEVAPGVYTTEIQDDKLTLVKVVSAPEPVCG